VRLARQFADGFQEAGLKYRLSGPASGQSIAPSAISRSRGWAGSSSGQSEASNLNITVIARGDGAIAIDCGAALASASSNIFSTPVVFRFREPGAADAVINGCRRRLANERTDASEFWYLDTSAGQVAAAIKAEAKGLCCSFAVVHPYLSDAPIIRAHRRSGARRRFVYAIIFGAGALIGLIGGFALKSFLG
jgi:hypothetical protein